MPGLIAEVQESQLKKPVQLLATPSVYLIDQNGIIRDGWIGPKDLAVLEEKIKALGYL